MSESIKFTEEELKKLGEVQTTYQNIQASMGQIAVQKMVLEDQIAANEEAKEAVIKQWKDAQIAERELVKELNDKYGPGTLNPETGEFTPAPPQEAPAEQSTEG
tara:strand:- start:132 stop:443 length:312 start_codon:yes stop_codon:yes gene_type:complete